MLCKLLKNIKTLFIMKLFWQTKQFHNKTIMWQMKKPGGIEFI